MANETQLLLSLAYIALMLLLGLIFRKFPPKKINSLYGYRTKRSMANQATWRAANGYWTRVYLKSHLYLLALPPVLYFVYPEFNVLVTVIVHSVVLLLMIPATERYLRQKFNAQGGPK